MITSLHSTIKEWQLTGQRTFVRCDFNVPLGNGRILNDYKLISTLPTLKELVHPDRSVLMATHIGRPQGPDQKFSTKHLIPWFEQHELKPVFAETVARAHHLIQQQHPLVLLENLRFFPGEKKQDYDFAQKLASLADYYVDDAFGSLHRSDTSITLLAQQFDANHRSIGFLVAHELRMLNTLLDNPEKPFVLIVGGGKVADKIPFIESLLPLVDTILICPAVACTFLEAQGIDVGASLVDRAAIPEVERIMHKAQDTGVELLLPEDFIVAEGSFNGPLSTTTGTTITPNAMAISIGPKTLARYSTIIRKAKTVFYNGLMGSLFYPETLDSANALFHAMTQSSGTTIIAGGDSVGAVYALGIEKKITYLSTGGGATLAYLAGQELPGLAVFTH